MDKIWNTIVEGFLDMLRGLCLTNIDGMFDSVNARVGTIAIELGKTPQQWSGSIFTMIKNISDTVIVPIAGMILTGVLVYEFLSLIIEKNNMHDVPIETFGKIFLKMGVSIYLLSHTFDFVMAIFDVAQNVVASSAGIIMGDGVLKTSPTMEATILAMTDIGELISIGLLALVLGFVMSAINIAIMIVLYGRMIQIYMYCSIAPIPFATFGNKEWGSIGNNYIKAILALAFQAFLMIICVAIYTTLVASLSTSTDIQKTLLEMVGYTVLLVITLFQTHKVAQSIFNAH